MRHEFEEAHVDDVDASIAEFISDGRMPAIRQSVRRSKAVNWLVEHAEVTEVDEVAEARAQHAEEAATREETAAAEETPEAEHATDGGEAAESE